METQSPVCAAEQQQVSAVRQVWTCSGHGAACWRSAGPEELPRLPPGTSAGTGLATGLQGRGQWPVGRACAIFNPCGFNVTGNVVI